MPVYEIAQKMLSINQTKATLDLTLSFEEGRGEVLSEGYGPYLTIEVNVENEHIQ